MVVFYKMTDGIIQKVYKEWNEDKNDEFGVELEFSDVDRLISKLIEEIKKAFPNAEINRNSMVINGLTSNELAKKTLIGDNQE